MRQVVNGKLELVVCCDMQSKIQANESESSSINSI